MEIKNVSENAKKSSKICYRDNWQQTKYLPGQKTSKNILPGFEPEKVENHWVIRVFWVLRKMLNILMTFWDDQKRQQNRIRLSNIFWEGLKNHLEGIIWSPILQTLLLIGCWKFYKRRRLWLHTDICLQLFEIGDI